jgi:AraC-like DNA-binding protein
MKKATILVVEDEQDIRDLISFQLKSEGHTVIAAESADKAISVLERGEHIDLFIIKKAKIQLQNQELSISQVAYDLGFEYPNHFSKFFKSKTGLSPSEYRNVN